MYPFRAETWRSTQVRRQLQGIRELSAPKGWNMTRVCYRTEIDILQKVLTGYHQWGRRKLVG